MALTFPESRWRKVRRILRRIFVYGWCVVFLGAAVFGNVMAPNYEGILTIFA